MIARLALAALAALLASSAWAQTPPFQVGGAVYQTSAPTPAPKQSVPFQADSSGNLKVNVIAGGGTGGTSSSFGAAFPGTGTAAGFKDGGGLMQPAIVDGSGNLDVNCVVGCSGGTFNNNSDAVATSATNGQAAAWLYGFNGTTFDRLRVDGSKNLQVNVQSSVLPTGAATATGLSTINTTLGSPFQAGGSIGNTSFGATQSGTWTVQPGNTANTTPWLATINQGGNSATVSAGGALKVDASGATQPVSGTVTANQGGAPWTVKGVGTAGTADSGVLTVQGIASMTKLLVTPDANSAVNVAQFGGNNVVTGTGTGGNGIPRVTVSSDSAIANTGFAAQVTNSTGAGQAVIGCDSHVFKHITSATDTLAVQGVTAKVVRICGAIARFSGSAAQTVYLENTASTNANCSSTLTQITGAWVGNATAPSGAGFNGSFWNGLANTSGNGLCVNSSGTGGVDIDIWYEQS